MSVPGSGSGSRLGWYARRLGRMSPAEMAWRSRDQVVKSAWARRQVRPEDVAVISAGRVPAGGLEFAAVLPGGTVAALPDAPAKAVVAAADQLMRGEWEVLGVARADLDKPDWFRDPVTGVRSDPGQYAFRINHRSRNRLATSSKSGRSHGCSI